ncbi:hypothetical protein EVAR_35831_1 [Eumeta japonica]|uniref:Uncharacterized protein n=1 Tax=Eumeta variegata TaxID=151549 RepID=A0A4C1WVP9_EUMVA|nr:hypothetical protein EVAR_35831_1 [Eumeta japonica]
MTGTTHRARTIFFTEEFSLTLVVVARTSTTTRQLTTEKKVRVFKELRREGREEGVAATREEGGWTEGINDVLFKSSEFVPERDESLRPMSSVSCHLMKDDAFLIIRIVLLRLSSEYTIPGLKPGFEVHTDLDIAHDANSSIVGDNHRRGLEQVRPGTSAASFVPGSPALLPHASPRCLGGRSLRRRTKQRKQNGKEETTGGAARSYSTADASSSSFSLGLKRLNADFGDILKGLIICKRSELDVHGSHCLHDPHGKVYVATSIRTINTARCFSCMQKPQSRLWLSLRYFIAFAAFLHQLIKKTSLEPFAPQSVATRRSGIAFDGRLAIGLEFISDDGNSRGVTKYRDSKRVCIGARLRSMVPQRPERGRRGYGVLTSS